MASVFNKKGKIYISWYDWAKSRTQNKSTKLDYTPTNMDKAKKLAEMLQSELDKKKQEYEKQSLVKKSTIKSAFEHFLQNNSTKHSKTIKDYRRFYNLFIKTFSEDSQCTVIDKIGIESWINRIKVLPYQQNTIHGYFKQCNHFLNFLFEYNYVPMFKINTSVKTKPEVKEIIVFSDEDLRTIFNNLKDKNSNFYTMIYLAYYTGLRSSDILTITVDRVDLDAKTLSYYSPKTKRYLIIPIHEKLVPILRKRVEEVKHGNLLVYHDYDNMNKAFNRYLKVLGLDGRGYSMRIFRKTFITNASQVMDLSTVSQLVGHKQITTTAKYYNKVDLQRKKKELDKFKGIEGAE